MAPNHYLNQCWNIVNWTFMNKLQWNYNRNWNIFIQENALKNGVCEMASILSWPQCVNSLWPSDHMVTYFWVSIGNGCQPLPETILTSHQWGSVAPTSGQFHKKFSRYQFINPLLAKFFRGNINIYLHFVSFLYFDTMQVVEMLPQIRQEPSYST